MTYSPPEIAPHDPVFVQPMGPNSLGTWHHSTRAIVPASATPTTNRILFFPFWLNDSYLVSRWWWLNGAAVGTDYVEVGVYDENFLLIAGSPRTLSAGSINNVQAVSPGVLGANVIAAGDSTDGTVFTTASVTLKAGVLYLMAVENSASNAAAVSSIDSATAGCPTFTSRSTVQWNGTGNRTSIWSAVPTVDWTGALRINFGATQTGAAWNLDAMFHVDTATADGIVQQATGTGNSVTPLATLAAFGSAENATYGAFGTVNGAATASAGYVKLGDGSATTPAQRVSTSYRPDNDTTVDTTTSSNQWGACAVEVKSKGTGTAVALPKMRGYLAMHTSGTTMRIYATTQATAMSPVVYRQDSAAGGLPAVATPVAGAGSSDLRVFGFTRRVSP